MKLAIDKLSNIPIYKQMTLQLKGMIEKGILKKGDKLPTENELIRDNKISKGTIKKAYMELEKCNYIEKIQGSGTFVSIDINKSSISQGERIVKSTLEKLSFVSNEKLYKIFLKELEKATKEDERIKIAFIDCSEEVLSITCKQIEKIKNVKVSTFLLEDLNKGLRIIDGDYDIIATTIYHYEEVSRLLLNKYSRVEKLALNLSNKTISEMVKISEDEKISILYRSNNFLENIETQFRELKKDNIRVSCRYSDEIFFMDNELYGTDIMFVPNDCVETKNQEVLKVLDNFKLKGKRIIPFEYVIDEGSLLRLKFLVKEKKVNRE